MKFPIYDISDYSWNRYWPREHNILYENPYTAIIPINRKEFKEKIQKFRFIDSTGVIYQVTSYELLPGKGFLSVFFFIKRIQLHFIKTEDRYSLEQFKSLLLKRAKESKNRELELKVIEAETIKDIIAC